MPAKHVIDIKAMLLITTWEGEAIDNKFIEAIKKYQADIQSNSGYHGFNEVVDLTKVTKIKLTTKGIINIGSIASSTDKTGVETKLAIIVSSNLAFGLARMYEALRSFSTNSTKIVKVFKNESDAFEWVKK